MERLSFPSGDAPGPALRSPTDRSYLDWASTAPLHPAARAALLAAWDEGWGDPTRLYREGQQAARLLAMARESVAEVLGVRADEVWFPRSGTEAAQLAVLGAAGGRRRIGRRLVTSPVEHSCVLAAGEQLAAAGGQVDLLEVDGTGAVRVPDRLPPDTALVSLQSANQELGTLQPVAAVAALCRAAGVPLHVDAAQSLGRAPVRMAELGADLLTGSGHKFGGPPGVGILVTRTGTRWRNPDPADERGGGRVRGFEDVPGVVATAAALQARRHELIAEGERLTGYVERLRTALPQQVPDVALAGPAEASARLPHLLTASFLYVDGERLVGALDAAGFAVSSGSACTASSITPSHVLEAVGALTHGNVRIAFGRDSDDTTVDRLLAVLPVIVADLRAEAGVAGL
ncbi:MAG: cysteine desulfurase [Frankiaceae bacterium]|nr:cysteine desulfurase [Frankiaceae bacterium]